MAKEVEVKDVVNIIPTKDHDDTNLTGKEGGSPAKDESDPKEKKDTLASGAKRKSEDGPEKKSSTTGGIALKLNKPKDTSESSSSSVKTKKVKLSSIFNDDSESEEEMPLECKMKMRNIGRETATSAGPKSFNKGKQGFTNNSFKVFELSMKPRNNMEKQTSYDNE